MPHYKDGTPAEIGDVVKGKPYNTTHEVVGNILKIVPGDSCNCEVLFLERMDPESKSINYGISHRLHVLAGDGSRSVFQPKIDYGETKAFELVHREPQKTLSAR